MPRSPRIPSYRRHASGQARVTIDGKDHLLGPYDSPESQQSYRRIIAEWLDRRGRFVPTPAPEAPPLTINELILAYYRFAEKYYGFEGRKDGYCLRDALRVVKDLYGETPAAEFGPKALKACRTHMITKDWSRTYTNSQVDRIRRMFRWGAEEELIPGSVYQNLKAVTGLRMGKSEARETQRVLPVPREHVDAALALLSPTVAAMVRLQLISGCRPAEVCSLRPCDVDRSNPACWVYRPGSDEGPHGKHKTAHHGHDRLIFLGPLAQATLEPFLGGPADLPCFRPERAESARNENRRLLRQTPMTPSQRARQRSLKRSRGPGTQYSTHSYRRAIERACLRAQVPVWAPNRLRHTRATELRKYGLDLTKTVLGHSRVETTLIYAEKDVQAAMKLVSEIG